MNTSTATTTTTSGAKASAASVAASSKLKTFAISFSTSAPVIYITCLIFNWPLFTFHPVTNRIVFGWEGPRPGEGPNMLWYGWTASTVLAATVVGIVATMLPEHIVKRIPLNLVWLLPILAIPYVVYSLMPWWTH
ncbi:MAG TPA: hypothetical protein VIY51_10470 [Xanthobacteraceae bacterium]